MDAIRIFPPPGILRGRIRLPASKSISNRALILRWLSHGNIRVENLSKANDTSLLEALFPIIGEHMEGEHETILDCGNTGTVMRFLTALLAVTPGTWLLTGSDRMKERPIGPLVDSLKRLGAAISHTGCEGFPPLRIEGRPLRGGRVRIEAGVSSQYITALLLIAPTLPHGLQLDLEGPVGSRPYIDMTIAMLRKGGIRVEVSERTIVVHHQDLKPCALAVEPDWSAAAFWYEVLGLAGSGELLLEGLTMDSIQGDAAAAHLFHPLGVESAAEAEGVRIRSVPRTAGRFEHDFTHCPDLAQALAATCAGLGIEGRLTGLHSLRIKETDRLEALRHELSRTGTRTSIKGDSELFLYPAKAGYGGAPIRFATWDDHRMAMALAPLCLRLGELVITDPQVVIKSYPGFWDDLAMAGFKIIRS